MRDINQKLETAADRSVGLVNFVASRPIMILVVFLFIVDMMGTLEWVREKIGTGGGELFGFYVPGWGWVAVGVAMAWMMTTAIQVYATGLVMNAGVSNPYLVAIGAYIYYIGEMAGLEEVEDNMLVKDFLAVQEMHKGHAAVLLFYYPSHIFDVFTDISWLTGTPFAFFAIFLGASSLMSELFAYVGANAWVRGQDAMKALREED